MGKAIFEKFERINGKTRITISKTPLAYIDDNGEETEYSEYFADCINFVPEMELENGVEGIVQKNQTPANLDEYYAIELESAERILQGVEGIVEVDGLGEYKTVGRLLPEDVIRNQLNHQTPFERIYITGAEDTPGKIFYKYGRDRYKSIFVIAGTPEIPIISDISDRMFPNVTERPYWKEEEGKVVVYVNHFSGSGTQLDPFIITNRAELAAINSNPNSYYKLGNDIDLSSGGNWVPLNTFGGQLDGNGKKIINMTINRTANNTGLFSTLGAAARVFNLTIKDSNVTSTLDNTGALCGQCLGTGMTNSLGVKIDNVTVVGRDCTGGSAGLTPSGFLAYQTVINSEISGRFCVGGGVGRNQAATNRWIHSENNIVTHSSFFGGGVIGSAEALLTYELASRFNQINTTITTGDAGSGGVCGNINSGSVNLHESYAEGCTFGYTGNPQGVGGLIGYVQGGGIARCYASCAVSTTDASKNSVFGKVTGTPTIQNVYFNSSLAGARDTRATGKTAAELQVQATYVGFVFPNPWEMRAGGFAKLRFEPNITPPFTAHLKYKVADGDYVKILLSETLTANQLRFYDQTAGKVYGTIADPAGRFKVTNNGTDYTFKTENVTT